MIMRLISRLRKQCVIHVAIVIIFLAQIFEDIFSEKRCLQNIIDNTQFISDPLVIKLRFVLREIIRFYVYSDKCFSSYYCLCKSYLIAYILGGICCLFRILCSFVYKPMTYGHDLHSITIIIKRVGRSYWYERIKLISKIISTTECYEIRRSKNYI